MASSVRTEKESGMSYQFRPSTSETIGKQVFIALAGTTGAGKTESAMRIARGIVGQEGKFCVIDTENRRALNKRGRYTFDHLDMKAPYSPDAFKGAIDAAEQAKYGAIVLDNFSHEWFGEGGCSDMQEAALERLSGGDTRKAERLTALAWKSPKQAHKKLMYRILQCNVPIIFCLRAEPKIKFQKDENGKMQVVDMGWQPICEKMFGYEMLVYALLMPDNPGVPVHLKKLEQELEPALPLGKQINEQSGQRLAAWAAGTKSTAAQVSEAATPGPSSPTVGSQPASAAPVETRQQTMERLCKATLSNRIDLLAQAEVTHEDEMAQEDWASCVRMLNRKLARMAEKVQA